MKLSNKSRYGLRALIDLSVNSEKGRVPLNSIAERNGISPQYLEQIFASLKKAGIVKSVKGPQGGYYLALEASRITAASIIEALEGSYKLEDEIITEDTLQQGISGAVQELLIDRLNEKNEELLQNLSLDDLVNHYLASGNTDSPMYYI